MQSRLITIILAALLNTVFLQAREPRALTDDLFETYAGIQTYRATGRLLKHQGDEALPKGAFTLEYQRTRGFRVEQGDEVITFDGKRLLVRYPRISAHVVLDFETKPGWQDMIAIEGPATRSLRYYPVLALLQGLQPEGWTPLPPTRDLIVIGQTTPATLPSTFTFLISKKRIAATVCGFTIPSATAWEAHDITEERNPLLKQGLFSTTPPPDSADLTPQLVRQGDRSPHPLVGRAAPPLDAIWTGKAAVLEFWALWCPPCLENLPALNDCASRFPENVVVRGVNLDRGEEQLARARRFLDDKKITIPQTWAADDDVSEWNADLLPMMVIVRPDRIVHHVKVGSMPSFEELNELANAARNAASKAASADD